MNPQKKFNKSSTASKAVDPENSTPINTTLMTRKVSAFNKFVNDFEILSVLRNLKIIGIFTRLALRDNKKKYVKMIPYAWEMINYRMKKNREFVNLKLILKRNFPKFVK